MIYLDTHVVAWLYAGRTDLLPPSVCVLLEENDLLISPAVKLELQYLFEIGRTAEPASTVLQVLSTQVGLAVCDLPFAQVVESAMDQAWTRDPFDRLIVGQARLRDATLLTKDRTIRKHFRKAVWKR